MMRLTLFAQEPLAVDVSRGARASLSVCALLASAGAALAQVGPNVDELAKELSNPGAANATLNFKFEYRSFDGDLDGSDDQSSTTLTFQPVLPFILDNGHNLIFRPAFPYTLGQPSPSGHGGFDNTYDFGDIPYDLLYSWSTGGYTFGAGVVGSIPTGTDLSSENWLLGPSMLVARPTDWGIWGLFPFHNEKIGGDGADTSITSLQYFLFYSLGDGWQIGTGPTNTYDWNAPEGQEWTVPVQLALSKTTAIGTQLIKLNLSAERNVIAPDAFAENWTYTFQISPVTSNPFQRTSPAPPVDAATRAAALAPLR